MYDLINLTISFILRKIKEIEYDSGSLQALFGILTPNQ